MQQALVIAGDHHRHGRLVEAQTIYGRVLEKYPANATALEGLGATAAKALVEAQSPEDFAAAVADLLESGRGPALGAQASACVREHYGWSRSLARLQALLAGPAGALPLASGE